MAQEISENLLLKDEAGVHVAMRAEAAARAQAANNWMMAALITANGGASLALLSNAERGLAMIIALALFMLGVTAALLAGRLAASFAYETEALFGVLIRHERAQVHLFRASQAGLQSVIARAEKHRENLDADLAKQQGDFDKAMTPDLPLGLGVIFFFFGCIAAGFALF